MTLNYVNDVDVRLYASIVYMKKKLDTIIHVKQYGETQSTEIATMAKKQKSQKEALQQIVDEAAQAERPTRRSSGNVPFRRKYYAIDKERYEQLDKEGELKKLPGQVQGILKFLYTSGLESTGPDICAKAIEQGFVATKIDPPVLFAYYRKRMEGVCLKFTGYKDWTPKPKKEEKAATETK